MDGIVAADKPEGMPSIPDRTGSPRNLRSILQEMLGTKLFVVHRLDMPTSGIILFARTPGVHRMLCLAFESGAVRKTYHAVVLGSMQDEEGLIDEPLRRFGSGRVWVDRLKGKPSLTRFSVTERGGDFTVLDVRPETGRQHQIRAHLAFLGHPVAGDGSYPGPAAGQPGASWPRLMLHASRIEIDCGEGERRVFRAGLPDSFVKALENARRAGDGREPDEQLGS
jgi:RluA family pseudouridine synthase